MSTVLRECARPVKRSIMAASAHRTIAPKPSNSPFFTPLTVINRVTGACRKQPVAQTATSILATVAMLAGGMIYVLWRSDTLLMFAWFDALGMRPAVGMLREYAALHFQALPHWVVFSLPQALWLFSGILYFQCIWRGANAASSMLWTGAFVAIAFGFELGQLLNLVPGYFDVWDALSLIAAYLLALAVLDFTSTRRRRVQA